MDYDVSEFELSVGGDDELLTATLDPRVSLLSRGRGSSFRWQVTIDRVTGQDLPLGEHQLEVTVTEDSDLSVGTMSCTLPFTIDIIQYGG
jgi:L-arabinose isomerase